MTAPSDPASAPARPTAEDGAATLAPSPRPSVDSARWGRHPAMRVVALCLGGLITVVALALGGLAAANALVRTSESGFADLDGPIRRVEVRVDGRVSVRPGPADRSTVAWRTTFGLDRPDLTHTLVNGLLTVRLRCGEGVSFVCDTRVDLTIPREASLSVHGLGVDVRDIDGDLDIDSGAGQITLTRVSGRIDASVGGGSIVGRDLASEEVRATAGAGAVELGFDVAPRIVEAEAGAGSVVVGLPPGDETYRVDAESSTSARTIDVRTDPTSDRVIRAHSGAGSVDIRYQA